ncbi:hypothetical protein [Kribbella deserti]|uniref:Uncharacterized protein n=1 Tax=Kribbella deserti TaxID=1926257 RepID=A0ABV6QE80_9ACTN
MTLRATTCVEGAKIVLALMKLLAGPAPTRVPAQHPLIYKPGEPDVPAAGACAD